jgi:hypothetical protein
VKDHYSTDDLDQPFQIIRKTRVADGVGGFTESESTLPSPSTYHLAKVRPLRGEERQIAGHIATVNELSFVVIAGLGILPTDTLLYAGARYNVRRLNPPGRSRFQELEAETGVADA